jgi:hypothetical protein
MGWRAMDAGSAIFWRCYENLFTILLRSAGGPRVVLAMLTYRTYAALVLASPWAAPLRHEPPAFARDRP